MSLFHQVLSSEAAQAPDIYGYISGCVSNGADNAFTRSGVWDTNRAYNASDNTMFAAKIEFSASRYNEIYNGSTIRPISCNCKYFIKF